MSFKRLIWLFLCCAVFGFGVTLSASAGTKIIFKAVPVDLNEKNPSLREIGRLIYRGGLKISSDHNRFGGLSALSVSTDRQHFIAIGDRGIRIDGSIIYGPKGNLKNLSDLMINELSGIGGKAFRTGYDGDSESIARLPNGKLLISFERNHRLLVYSKKVLSPLLSLLASIKRPKMVA